MARAAARVTVPDPHRRRIHPFSTFKTFPMVKLYALIGGHFVSDIRTVRTPKRVAFHLGIVCQARNVVAVALRGSDIPIAFGLCTHAIRVPSGLQAPLISLAEWFVNCTRSSFASRSTPH